MTEVSATKFEARVRSGKPIVVVEVTPPKGGDPAALRAAAKRFAGKVHAIGVSDNRHGVRMSALAAAGILAAEGAEPIVHIVTRDRNRLALLGTCLGAQALGVRNIFCTSGTHQTLGICPPAKNVFDIDSVQFIDAVAHLGNGGSAACTETIAGAGPFCVGGVAAPFADPPELQLMRLAKKMAVGAKFLITQPVYDVERFKAWWDKVTQQGLHEKAAILAGIQPLLNAEEAKAYAASRPSPAVPEAVLEKLAAAGDGAAQRAAGIEAAVDTIRQLSQLKGLRGFQVNAEDDEDAAFEILERAALEV
jgi:methylenetetrahydrofolate reductase (NADPH)